MAEENPFPEGLNWYCIRTKRFSERLVGGLLRAETGMEIFCPYIRYERARRTGKTWVSEALFPNYLFGRFHFQEYYRMVLATRGVLRVVGFGGIPSVVPDEIISDLRAAVSDAETVEISSQIEEGDEVSVVSGPMCGVQAIVSRVLPAKRRVLILMELLGQEREVEVDQADLLAEHDNPLARGKSHPSG